MHCSISMATERKQVWDSWQPCGECSLRSPCWVWQPWPPVLPDPLFDKLGIPLGVHARARTIVRLWGMLIRKCRPTSVWSKPYAASLLPLLLKGFVRDIIKQCGRRAWCLGFKTKSHWRVPLHSLLSGGTWERSSGSSTSEEGWKSQELLVDCLLVFEGNCFSSLITVLYLNPIHKLQMT